MQDLGTLGGLRSYGLGINDEGWIVGQSSIDVNAPTPHAFVWDGSAMRDLGTLGGLGSSANAINGARQIVGVSDITPDQYHATLWQDGVPFDLGALPGAFASAALAINDNGWVAGLSSGFPVVGDSHATLWANGKAIELANLGGEEFQSAAYGINNHGKAVGHCTIPSGDATHAVLWTISSDGSSLITDLGTLGGRQSIALGVNKYDEVVGQSETASGDTHAFLWTPRRGMQDLGTLGGSYSIAIAVNDLGEVVGQSGSGGFIWPDPVDGEGMAPLFGLPGGPGGIGHSINNRGQISGTSRTFADFDHAALWIISSPRHQILMIILQVKNLAAGSIGQGEGAALVAKLEAALRVLDGPSISAPVSILEAFVQQVLSLARAEKLSAEEAASLIDSVNAVIASIGG